jgi:hypothetical protein
MRTGAFEAGARGARLNLRWPLAIATCAGLALPASGLAATTFGARLVRNGMGVQPANAGYDSCHFADPMLSGASCTRVAVQFGDIGAIGGNSNAPKNGTIKEIKLIAATKGVMVPYVAEVKGFNPGSGKGRAKVTAKGPTIHYKSSIHGYKYKVQTFHVKIKVSKGEYLGIKAKKTSMLRCTSGSTEQLLYQPPLQIGNPFAGAGGTDDCVLLIQAVYG